MKLAIFGLIVATVFTFLTLLAVDALEFEQTGECQDCLILPHVRNL